MRGWGGRHIMWRRVWDPASKQWCFNGIRARRQSPFETGLPPAQSGEDVPRWLVILGLVAGLTLLVALLRYAVDLLGVVFVIILVGFAIRALSDWLTEGESVSGWAMSALSLGLMGTVLVGLWLFNSRDLASEPCRSACPGRFSARCRGWSRRGGASACCCPAVRRPQSLAVDSRSARRPRRARPTAVRSRRAGDDAGAAASPRCRRVAQSAPSRAASPRRRGRAPAPGEAEAATSRAHSRRASPRAAAGTARPPSPPASR